MTHLEPIFKSLVIGGEHDGMRWCIRLNTRLRAQIVTVGFFNKAELCMADALHITDISEQKRRKWKNDTNNVISEVKNRRWNQASPVWLLCTAPDCRWPRAPASHGCPVEKRREENTLRDVLFCNGVNYSSRLEAARSDHNEFCEIRHEEMAFATRFTLIFQFIGWR